MRDKKRIPKLLKMIERVWTKYPDMRFGQLIVNCLGTDPFYIEDGIAEKKIAEFGKIESTEFQNIYIDDFQILEKEIPTKFIKFEGKEVNLNQFLKTIENLLNKNYLDTSNDKILEILEKKNVIFKNYNQDDEYIYEINDREELENLYEKIIQIIE